MPTNENKNLFDGPDPPNPCYRIPDGEVDVYAIVSGRRRLDDEDSWMNVAEKKMPSAPLSVYQASNRSLASEIVPGKGWQLFGEPPGYCDGTYNSICNRATECVLQGHQAG